MPINLLNLLSPTSMLFLEEALNKYWDQLLCVDLYHSAPTKNTSYIIKTNDGYMYTNSYNPANSANTVAIHEMNGLQLLLTGCNRNSETLFEISPTPKNHVPIIAPNKTALWKF